MPARTGSRNATVKRGRNAACGKRETQVMDADRRGGSGVSFFCSSREVDNNGEAMRRGLSRILVLVLVPMAVLPAAEAATSFPKVRVGKPIAVVEKPTHIANAGDGSGRLFLVEQRGTVRTVKNGRLRNAPFLDIRDRVGCCGERGLLSIAFPPGKGARSRFYVNYTDRRGTTIVSRFRVSAKDPDRADRRSEEILLRIEQPFRNHNGGQLAFGPDGLLYIGTGDGGAAYDPFGNGQSKSTLLGKLLRIDVEGDNAPYAVPETNPFVHDQSARPEIWAYGLRNPWRFSFDRLTGGLYIADVGEGTYEEIDYQPAGSPGGENYGWNIMEGSHCLFGKKCASAGRVLPVAEYHHRLGCSVTGGMVYRGTKYPSLAGLYLYGDFCSGRIWGLRSERGTGMSAEVAKTELAISTFGEDEDGELLVADYASGGIYPIIPVVP